MAKYAGHTRKTTTTATDANQQTFDEARAIQQPVGCSIVDDGLEILVRAKVHSWEQFAIITAIAVFFALVLFFSLENTLNSIQQELPHLNVFEVIQTGITQTLEEEFGFLVLFFIFAGIALTLAAIACSFFVLMGSIDFHILPHRVKVRHAFGPIGWSKQFDRNQFISIEQVLIESRDDSERKLGEDLIEKANRARGTRVLQINADKQIRIYTTIPAQRRDWLEQVITLLLSHPDSQRSKELLRYTSKSALDKQSSSHQKVNRK